jgi:hypothetical protein
MGIGDKREKTGKDPGLRRAGVAVDLENIVSGSWAARGLKR